MGVIQFGQVIGSNGAGVLEFSLGLTPAQPDLGPVNRGGDRSGIVFRRLLVEVGDDVSVGLHHGSVEDFAKMLSQRLFVDPDDAGDFGLRDALDYERPDKGFVLLGRLIWRSATFGVTTGHEWIPI